jgi:hypothetical protein
MNRQRGVSLSGLLVGVVILSVLALLGMKVVPSVLDYYQAVKAIKSVAQDGSLKGGSVADVRKAFDRQREAGYFKNVSSQDLEVTKEGGDLVLSFVYQDKIHLFANVSLVIDYEASTAK